METLKKLRNLYKGLDKRGKSVALIVLAVITIALVELFTGCSCQKCG